MAAPDAHIEKPLGGVSKMGKVPKMAKAVFTATKTYFYLFSKIAQLFSQMGQKCSQRFLKSRPTVDKSSNLITLAEGK